MTAATTDDAPNLLVELTVQELWEIVSALDDVKNEWGPTLPPDPLAERLRGIAESTESAAASHG